MSLALLGLGGSMPLGLLGRASCGWCCAVTALARVTEVLVRVSCSSGACTNSSRRSTGGSGTSAGDSGGTKRLTFKGQASIESSFLGFGIGPGVGQVQNGSC